MTGWKNWISGEVVEHTEFQSYLQDQVVQVYAGTAARSSALGTAIAEGMVAYLEDTNAVQVYDGSAWQTLQTSSGTVAFATNAGTANYATLAGTAVSISGSIAKTQVTGTAVTLADTATVTNAMLAGSIENAKLLNSQITLNGSAVALGGSLTISGTGFSNPMTTLGDLIVGGTAGVAGRLGIGTSGQYLFTNGTVASWGNIAPTQITAGTFNAGSFAFSTAVTTGNTLTTGNAMRNITMSTADPSGGADGDVWLKYTP